MSKFAQLRALDARLLRIIGRMALVSTEDLVPIFNIKREEIQKQLVALRNSGWVTSTRRGMLYPERELWLLSPSAVNDLYATDHLHMSPEDLAKAGGAGRFQAGLPRLLPGTSSSPLTMSTNPISRTQCSLRSPTLPLVNPHTQTWHSICTSIRPGPPHLGDS